LKIRTQLLLACLVLSVVPLTGVVFYSYRSSKSALEHAYQSEAARLTAQMDRRLTAIGNDLDRRLTALASVPLPNNSQKPIVDNAIAAMEDVGPLLDTLEFEPAMPPTPAPPSVAPPTSAATAPPAAEVRGATPEPPAEPIIIKMNPLPPDFSQRISDIANLSASLSNASPEERQQIEAQLNERRKELKADVDAHKKVFQDQVQAAREQRTAEREARDVTRIVHMHQLTAEQKQQMKQMEKQTTLLFGQKFNVPLHSGGEVVGHIRAQLSTAQVIRRVLGAANDDNGEIPFVVDREGTIYTRNDTERQTLAQLGIIDALTKHQPVPRLPNWVVATSVYQQSGVRIGAARPIGDNLDELRRTAARNFGWGVGVIALALIGILPVAGHFTRDIHVVAE